MATINNVVPIKPIMGLLYSPELNLSLILDRICQTFGTIDRQSTPFDYTHSHYYESEMGPGLKKCFLSIHNLMDPSQFHSLKHISNKIEKQYSKEEKRQLNLDPGALTLHNLMLLSTKNFSHRIPLNEGIYAELTLIYKNNSYTELPWTYPDYKTPGALSFFKSVRQDYHSQR